MVLHVQQLYAGYILDSVGKCVEQWKEEERNTLDWDDVLRFLACFDLISDSDLSGNSAPSIIAVAENILCRGIPTKASYWLEKKFYEKYETVYPGLLSLHEPDIGEIGVEFNSVPIELERALRLAFAPIDPNWDPNNFCLHDFLLNVSGQDKGKVAEESEFQFLYRHLPSQMGKDAGVLSQIIELQRMIDSIIDYPGIENSLSPQVAERLKLDLNRLAEKANFHGQRVDFSVQFPFAEGLASGTVIELDGTEHSSPEMLTYDNRRDNLLKRLKWNETIRIKTDDQHNLPNNKLELVKAIFSHPYGQLLRQNYHNPLDFEPKGKDALDLVLTPMAVARIQRVILRAIDSNVLSFGADVWRIAIRERDVSCAVQAIEDLYRLCNNLFILERANHKFPPIQVTVFNSDGEFNHTIPFGIDEGATYHQPEFDLYIDISMLRRRYMLTTSELRAVEARSKVWIRSCYAPLVHNIVNCRKAIVYAPILKEQKQETEESTSGQGEQNIETPYSPAVEEALTSL